MTVHVTCKPQNTNLMGRKFKGLDLRLSFSHHLRAWASKNDAGPSEEDANG